MNRLALLLLLLPVSALAATETLTVNDGTGAIVAPVSAATFRTANSVQQSGTALEALRTNSTTTLSVGNVTINAAALTGDGSGLTALSAANLSGTVALGNLPADLAAIGGLTSAADKLAYATGSHTWGLTTLTAAGRSLIAGADASAMRTTLGLVPGTNVQAQNYTLQVLADNSGTITLSGVQVTAISASFVQLIVIPRDTAPGGTVAGALYCNSVNHHFYGYTGSVWVQLDN